jgi:hypothetical protein
MAGTCHPYGVQDLMGICLILQTCHRYAVNDIKEIPAAKTYNRKSARNPLGMIEFQVPYSAFILVSVSYDNNDLCFALFIIK